MLPDNAFKRTVYIVAITVVVRRLNLVVRGLA